MESRVILSRLLLICLFLCPHVATANWLQFASSQSRVIFKDTNSVRTYPCGGSFSPEDKLALEVLGKCASVWVLVNYPQAGWFDPKSRKMLIEFNCRQQTYSSLSSTTYKKENAEGAGKRENMGTGHVPPETTSAIRLLYASIC
jgi:hypothetical protein